MAARIINGGMSLTAKFISLCIPTITLILVGTGAYEYRIQKAELIAASAASIEAVSKRLSANLAPYVWNLTKDESVRALHIEMSGEIIAIVVMDDKDEFFSGMVMQDGHPVAVSKPPTVMNKSMIKKFDVQWENKVVAHGEIYFVHDDLERELKQQLFRTLAQTLVVDALLSATLFLILSMLVTRPIRELTFVTEEVARTGDVGQKILVKSSDEVGTLARSFAEMMNRLQQRTAEASAIASGNLAMQVSVASKKDAFGNAFQVMVEALKKLVGQVSRSSTKVAEGSREISQTSQALSEGATKQAASLEEINSALVMITSQSKSNAESATKADELVAATRTAAVDGGGQMKRMVEAMREIDTTSREIAAIIKTIDAIAFQTNLLALNAAVEAARAGRHGSGFAVVAEEVRRLALRSAKASSETATMIEVSIKKVINGLDVANATMVAFQKIADGVTETVNLISKIVMSSREQALSLDQVSRELSEVDTIAQHNAAIAEKTASTSEQLAANATKLLSQLELFKISEDRQRRDLEKGEQLQE